MFLSGVNRDNKGMVEAALKKWKQLPEADRKPTKLDLDPSPPDPKKAPPKPPEGGMVLKVYTRNLKKDKKRELALITREDLNDKKTYSDDAWRWANGIYREPMPDVMWLTEDEWRSLVPAKLERGERYDVPDPIQKRLFRFHIIDGTYGLPFWWKLEDIRHGKLTLTVDEVGPVVRLRLEGAVLMASAEFAKASHGHEAKLTGVLEYDQQKRAFTRVDIVAVGDCWGGDREGGRFARPGRAPIGIAFELAKGDSPADLIPPKGSNFHRQFADLYFAAEKR